MAPMPGELCKLGKSELESMLEHGTDRIGN